MSIKPQHQRLSALGSQKHLGHRIFLDWEFTSKLTLTTGVETNITITTSPAKISYTAIPPFEHNRSLAKQNDHRTKYEALKRRSS